MKSEIFITVSGKTYSGWKNLSIKKNLDSITGSFSFLIKEVWLSNKKSIPFNEGDPVKIKCNDINLMSGYIDKISISDTPKESTLTLEGREKTEDIVDCSAELNSYEFSSINLLQLSKRLCAPFGINVFDNVGITGKTFAWTVQQGETVFQTIERASRKIGVLLISNDNGDIAINKIGSNVPDGLLEYGKNVIEGHYSEDYTSRFKKYITRGQSSDDDIIGLDSEGISYDNNIERYRPKIILIESGANSQDCQDRSEWESSVALARSKRWTITCQDWFQSERQMWEINQLVKLNYPKLKSNGLKLLINSVNYTKNSEGTKAIITLVDKNSYLQKKEIEKKEDDLF